MYVNGWFFDIYIQGSKKTTLRAESEIKSLPQGSERVSVIKRISPESIRGIRLIKLQRAHHGCLGANRR